MQRIEVNVLTGEQRVLEMTEEEVAAILAAEQVDKEQPADSQGGV